MTGRGWEYVYGAEAVPKHVALLHAGRPSLFDRVHALGQHKALLLLSNYDAALCNSAPCTDRWVCSFQKTNEISLIPKRPHWPSVCFGTRCLVPRFAQSLTALNTWDFSKLFSESVLSKKKNLWMSESKSAETLIELFLWYSTWLNTL